MLKSIGKSFWYVAISVVVVIVAGYSVGAIGAKLIKQKDTSSYLKQRAMLSEHVMSDMGTLRIGENLTDWIFEDLQLRPQRLSDLVNGTTIVMFIDPDCGACFQQFENIANMVTKSADWDKVVAISRGNPLHLLDLKSKMGIDCPLLYDADGVNSSRMNIKTFPLSVIVNDKMGIEQVVAGGLLESEINSVFNGER